MWRSMTRWAWLFGASLGPSIFEACLLAILLPVAIGIRDEGFQDQFNGSVHATHDGNNARRAINTVSVQQPEEQGGDAPQGNSTRSENNAYFRKPAIQFATERNKRPSEGYDRGPDIVKFSILLKSIGAIKVKQKSFTVSAVVTLQWEDPRLIKYVEEYAPDQQDFVTLDETGATTLFWNPHIIVANRAFGDKETVFYSMKIDKTGRVTEIRHFMIKMKKVFHTTDFPFDRHSLSISISPRALPSSEVQLVPSNDTTRSEVGADLFKRSDFNLVDSTLSSSVEPVWQKDGSELDRSSGVLTINVERKWFGVFLDTLWPDLLIVFASWVVLFFPPILGFQMPRAGGASVGFLTMITYHIRTLGMLPDDDNDNLDWIELWDECCIYLTITVAGTNIMAEWANYHWKRPDLARAVLKAGRFFLVYLAIVSLGTMSLLGYTQRVGLSNIIMDNMQQVGWVVRTLLIVSDALFIAWIFQQGNQPPIAVDGES